MNNEVIKHNCIKMNLGNFFIFPIARINCMSNKSKDKFVGSTNELDKFLNIYCNSS